MLKYGLQLCFASPDSVLPETSVHPAADAIPHQWRRAAIAD
jgi:hypothetical protein